MSEKSCVYDTANAACAAALCASEPMNASMNTPPMFIAIPWMPVGRPNRNSDRMMRPVRTVAVRPRGNDTTQPPRQQLDERVYRHEARGDHRPHRRAGGAERRDRAEPADEHDVEHQFSTVITMPRIIGVRASPAERSAPPSMKKTSMPLLNRNMMRRNGSASAFTSGAALTRSSSARREEVSDRRHDQQREPDRREERLIDGAVDLVFVARAGEAGDQHAHAGEQRVDEDDDDEEDLPRARRSRRCR